MRTFVRILAAAIVLSAAPAMFAQQPTIIHGQVTTETADHGLGAVIDGLKQQKDAVWIGYSIPVISKFSSGWNSSRIDYLEGNGDAVVNDSEGSNQSSDHAVDSVACRRRSRNEAACREPGARTGCRRVAVRLAEWRQRGRQCRRVDRSCPTGRCASSSRQCGVCDLDPPDEFGDNGAGWPRRTGNDLGLREKAAFWLANQRGHDGLAAIQRFAREDGDPKFREKLAFDLTLSKDPAALNELIRMAHEELRRRFANRRSSGWRHKGGKKVTEDLRTLATNDPNEQIRKSAVFALSRLPGDEAATQLIAVADSSKDPIVRRQAIFWLGQSNDPRALEYLTKMLKQ